MTRVAFVNITKDLECPPLTLCYLASYLKKNNQCEVRIIDINFEDIFQGIKSFNPDIIAISSHTIRFNEARKLAVSLKKISPAKIIIGGVHISTHKESFSKEFDIAVIGEGEKTFSSIVSLHDKNKLNLENLEKVNGIIFWKDNKRIKTPANPLEEDIDSIPFPDRSMLNKEYFKPKLSYNKVRGKEVIETGMLTSRGCPYKCAFCSASAFWSRIRFHSPKYVAEEIKYLVDNFRVNYIVIYDDFFAVSEKRLEEIKKEMKKNKTLGKVKFSCSARANVITDRLCVAMKELGVITVNFGFESGSERILKKLKGENVTVEQNLNAVKVCRKHGLDVTGSFIIGSPGEKIEDMIETKEMIKKMKEMGAMEIWCGVAVPYPGTKLWDYAIKNNLLKKFHWALADPSYLHNAIFLDKSVSRKEFYKIFKEIKDISMDIYNAKKPGLIRSVKEKFYYNKTLFYLSGKVLAALPNKLRERIIQKLGINENILTK
jgi:magnesium-protoporphyrin IX monomethyl ester (oxidative) cyclase